LLVNSKTRSKHSREAPNFVRLFSALNIDKFKNQIKNVNWQEIYCHSDTNEAY